jgi:hypothetical protein
MFVVGFIVGGIFAIILALGWFISGLDRHL